MSLISDKELFTNLIERQVGDFYETLRSMILNSIPKKYKTIAMPMIKQYEPKIIEQLQEKTDMLIEMSTLDESASLEDMFIKADSIVNEVVANFIVEKFGLPEDTVKMTLQGLINPQI